MRTNYLCGLVTASLLLANALTVSVFAQEKHTVPVTQQREACTITYKMADADGKVLYTRMATVEKGAKYRYEFKEYEFCTLRSIVDANKETISKDKDYEITDNTEVTCTYDIKLPFKISTEQAPVWYGLNLRDKTMVCSGETASVKYTTAVDRTEDIALWAFTGNPFTGFRLHNKAVGMNKAFWSDNVNETPILMDVNKVKGYWSVTAYNNNKSFQIVKPGTTQYLNDYENKGVVKYWDNSWAKNENGSKFDAFEYDKILDDARGEYNTIMQDLEATKGTGYVGSMSEADFTALTTQLASAQTRADFIKISDALNNNRIAFTHGRYYTITSAVKSKNDKPMALTATGQNTFGWSELSEQPAPNQLWLLHNNGTTMVISNANTGSHITQAGVLGRPTDIELKNLTHAQYSITIAGGQMLKAVENPIATPNATGKVEAGDGGLNSAAAWQFYPISEYKFSKKTSTYETLCLPFSVKIPAGITAYEFVSRDREKVLVHQVQGQEIKGNTPVLLEGEMGEYSFPIAHDIPTTHTPNSLVHSVLFGQSVPAGTYVLENRDGEVAFFKTDRARYLSNSVYLEAAGTTADKVAISKDNPTGIDELSLEQEATIYYDLQGRRHTQPTQGVYVTDKGKKIIVR